MGLNGTVGPDDPVADWGVQTQKSFGMAAIALSLFKEELKAEDLYKIRNIFLKDIDVTEDYAGSFGKQEVIRCVTTKKPSLVSKGRIYS